jgi:SAM-dependent methyltransferase
MTEEVRDWWEATAEYFQEDIDMGVGVDLTGPWAPDVDLFDDATVAGADVLELGCGGGQCTVALAQRGANVTGIDLSAAQLSHARDLAACFSETNRVLRPGGRFVFSMPHPYYDILDPDSGAVADSYFDTGRRVISHSGIDADEVLYRHMVGDVHNALRDAGFDVERLLEPGTDDPTAYDSGPWGDHVPDLLSRVPSVLVVDAVKPRPRP